VGDIKIDVVVTRSRRNVEIKINVPDEHVLAVVKESASSSGWKGFRIEHGVGTISSEVEKEENVKDNKKFIDTYQVYYYVHENIKLKLKKVKVKTDVQRLGKPTVYFSCKEGITAVWGDTFEIKEHLKAMGFKWNSLRKVWFIDAERSDVATKLSEFADVRIVD
ncbi:MAG: hypothetical protein NZ879_08565, partial [Archaeoglobaceae archaeon]|nr:hypothetical protein [Archaeoglobaceae archaeon]MDW8119016.1 hypothetical protein [Archaeoglobaceae archaeon]